MTFCQTSLFFSSRKLDSIGIVPLPRYYLVSPLTYCNSKIWEIDAKQNKSQHLKPEENLSGDGNCLLQISDMNP